MELTPHVVRHGTRGRGSSQIIGEFQGLSHAQRNTLETTIKELIKQQKLSALKSIAL
jgi:hypothetical protein